MLVGARRSVCHLRVVGVARARTDRAARACSASATFSDLGRGDVPGRVRVLQRGRLPAAVVPDGRRRERDGVGLQPAAAAGRADRQRHRVGPDRRPHRIATSCSSSARCAPGGRPVPVDRPPRRHRPADALVLDGHRRAGHRAVVRGLHADRPELGSAARGRHRDEQPDLLPADRRHGRADHRGHDLRQSAHRGDPGPAGGKSGVPQQFVDQFQAQGGGQAST